MRPRTSMLPCPPANQRASAHLRARASNPAPRRQHQTKPIAAAASASRTQRGDPPPSHLHCQSSKPSRLAKTFTPILEKARAMPAAPHHLRASGFICGRPFRRCPQHEQPGYSRNDQVARGRKGDNADQRRCTRMPRTVRSIAGPSCSRRLCHRVRTWVAANSHAVCLRAISPRELTPQ